MANQTVNVDRNLDDAAIAGLNNGEDITVNTGATLTINGDNRWSQQAAVIGNITIDAGTGGTVRIDGRDVWWVPFDGGSGTIPALGTAGTLNVTRGGTPVAEFLGIFTALGVAPSAGAMPATGFAKFRRTTAALADNDVLTLTGGATITVNSATGGQRGWLHIVGETASTINVPRLGLFEALGDWFELGETSGAASQTFQFPVADYCNAIQVETAPGSGVYEWWPSVGTTRWGQNNRIAQDVRGKVCSCTAAGVIQIALRGAVNNGFLPPAGCKVRIPNILVSSSASTNWALNNLYAGTAAWDFTTASAGALRFDKTGGTWYALFQQPYSIEVTDSSFQVTLNIQECATAPNVQRCAVGIPTNQDGNPLVFTSCFSGGVINDCVTFKYENENNDIGWNITDCDGFSLTNNKTLNCADNTAATLNRGGATARNIVLTRVTNSTVTNHANIGGHMQLSGCVGVTISGYAYADCLENRTTNSTNGVYAVEMSGTTANCVFEGPFENFGGLANVHPYLGLINFLNAYDCEIRNIGTPAAPYDCGSANQMGIGINFGGNDLRNVARRVYLQNTRTGPIGSVNSSSAGRCINVWGDAADGTAIAALNFAFRGGRMSGSTGGQTAVYGTHWADHFSSETAGRIRVHANEPTAVSAAECAETGGAPAFTSTGQVRLTVVGDQVTWTMPYFALGHTSLSSLTFTGSNQANHLLEFRADTGSGFGPWTELTNANLLAVGAIDPAVGVMLMIRATCTVANTGNQITYLTINTVTDAVSQQIQYPLPGVPLELTGLVPGSEVRIYVGTNPDTMTELAGVESSTATFATTHSNTGQQGVIVIFATGYQTIRIPLTFSGSATSIPVQQTLDRVFENL